MTDSTGLTCPNCKEPARPSYSWATMSAIYRDLSESLTDRNHCSVGPWGYLCKKGSASMGLGSGCSQEDYDRAEKPWIEKPKKAEVKVSIKVETEIRVYEEDGRDLGPMHTTRLVVKSHRNSDLVQLNFGDKVISVRLIDLESAARAVRAAG